MLPRIPVALGVTLALGLPACAGAAMSPAGVIAALNAERAANGIPARVSEVPEWSAGCRLHDDYRAANGGASVGHEEDPARPGWTAAGAAAGEQAVLAGDSWSDGDPYAAAPLHLMRIMDPRLLRAGADDRDGLSCLAVTAGIGPPGPSDVVYTVPGDGRAGVPPSELVRELPLTPGDLLGLPAGVPTGPHLLVLADGPFARDDATRIVAARLRGPAGPVAVRWIDDADPRVGPYIPPGGVVVPLAPLAPATTYVASATVAGADGVRLARTWSFRTAGALLSALPAPRPPRASSRGRARVRVAVRGRRVLLAAPTALAGRMAAVRVSRAGATRATAVRLRPDGRVLLRPDEAGSARTRIVVRVAGFAAAGVRWRVAPVHTSVGRARDALLTSG
jgi:hypothetical protein